MLSIEKIKELMEEPNMTDEEATIIRDEMREFVQIIYEAWLQKRAKNK